MVGRQLITIFSAPNYCGQFNNAAAVVCIDADMQVSFQQLRTQSPPNCNRPAPSCAADLSQKPTTTPPTFKIIPAAEMESVLTRKINHLTGALLSRMHSMQKVQYTFWHTQNIITYIFEKADEEGKRIAESPWTGEFATKHQTWGKRRFCDRPIISEGSDRERYMTFG